MNTKALFPDELFAVLKKSKAIRVRAGTEDHRFIGIWFVIVGSRVVARSWSVKPQGWYCTFLREPRGAIRIGKAEVAIRALPIPGKRFRDAVDRAYLKKYNTGWELKYAKDLTREMSRATTVEFVPTRA